MKNLIACLIVLISFSIVPNEIKATAGIPRTEMREVPALKKMDLRDAGNMEKSLSPQDRKALQNELRDPDKPGIIKSVFLIALGAAIAFVLMVIYFGVSI